MGVSRVKCRGSANPDDRRLREGATAGRQHDCTFDTLIFRGPGRAGPTRGRRSRRGAGFPPMTAKGSNPLPARSDSPDIIDGGPEGADIAPRVLPGKPEMPGLRASEADLSGPGHKIAKTTPCKVEWAPARSARAALRPGYKKKNGLSSRPPAPGADRLDDRDGGANAGLDIEIRVIQRVRVRRRFQGRACAVPVALIAFEDIRKHRRLVGFL